MLLRSIGTFKAQFTRYFCASRRVAGVVYAALNHIENLFLTSG